MGAFKCFWNNSSWPLENTVYMNGFVMPAEALDLDGTCEVKGTFKNVISHMLIFKNLYMLCAAVMTWIIT